MIESAIQIIGSEELGSIAWPKWQLSQRTWLEPFVLAQTKKFIRNIRTEVKLIRLGEMIMPLTINDEELENSYVCSPYTAYVSYAKEELQKLGTPLLIYPLKGLLFLLSGIMKVARINRVVHCNNWLLSTNLYDDVQAELIPELTKQLVQTYPTHFILFRSLNACSNAILMKKLFDAGYSLIPSRQVYIFDRSKIDFLKRKNVKRDLELLKRTHFKLVNHVELMKSDYPRIVELYNALYLEKYSFHNPQFTTEFIELCHSNRLMTMHGLRDNSGVLQGIVGHFERGGIMTTPLVGYNTAMPRKEGLYRMLIALVLRDAASNGIVLNLSSGAAGFKRLRGGIPEIEYSAAFVKHLSLGRRTVIYGIRALLNCIGVPLMKAFKL